MLDISDYEKMAKLSLPEDERAWVSNCADILTNSFEELEKVDTKTVEPLVTVLDIRNVMREDIATDATTKLVSREELLSNAPEQYDGYFQVPKTLD